jgi:acyl-[acyl-carrier-protein]-phospholipid O-acyltransferase/long-chain-fatty-acid--[acyl-carrier-protein] ligase
MWKTKGTIPYFVSMFASTFVLMGHFIFTQKLISDTYAAEQFLWESALLQGLFLLPFVFMIVPASFLSNKFPKGRVITWTSVVMTLSVLCIAIFYTLDLAQLGYWFTLLLASAFAVHSPAKYGILKEMYGTRHLGYANAYLQVFSVAALICASWMMIGGLAFGRAAFNEIPTISELLSKTVALPWILLGFSVLSTIFFIFYSESGS